MVTFDQQHYLCVMRGGDRCKLRIQFAEVHTFLESLMKACAKGLSVHEPQPDGDGEHRAAEQTACVAAMAMDADKSSGVLSIFAVDEHQQTDLVLSLRLVRAEFAFL